MTGQAQAGRQRYAARSWQLVTSRVARLGDQYLLQLSADHKAVAEFYGDYERKARQQWYDAGADQDMQIVAPLPTLEEVREAVQQYAAEINRRASQSGLDSGDQTGDSSEPATPQGHREKRVRLEASEQPATSAAELLRFLEASSPEAWIGSVAFQVALWARALRASPAPVLMDAIACEEDYMHRAQMGVFATGEAPLVPPNPLLPVLVRCGTELSYKSDIFALFLALLVYPDRSDEAESGMNPDMITRLDSFCQRLARQVAETVLGLFCGALRHMTTGAPLAEELLMVSTASKAQATATTTSFRNLPPVLQARRTLRFLAELANAHLIDSEWFVRHILHDLLTETALFGADHDKAPLSRSQALVELALEGLLHCGREAERVAADQVDAILHAAERFAGTSRSPESVTRECACMERLFSPVKTGSNTSMSTMEPSSASVHVARRLHELLAGCRQLRARAWHSTLLPQYYLLFWDTHIRKAGLRLSLNTPSVPRHSVDARYPVPSMRLHITKVELMSVASALGTNRDVGSPEIEPAETEPGSMHGSIPFMERFLAVERLTDMLDAFLADRHLCVRMLRRPTPGLSSTDHQVVLVETLLNGMLELPRSRNPLLFYAAVLVELCRGGDPQTAIYLLQAVETLIREARRLDTEVMDRIAAWLAFHLSHFQWEWNWDAWIPLLSDVHSAALITSMLEYAVRLSYRERIQEAIPSEFHRLLVPRPEPCWDFITVHPNEHAGAPLESVPEAVEVGLAKRLAESTYDVVPYLNEHVPKEQRAAVYLRSMLRGGHEAPSFFATMVENWGGVLRHLRDEQGAAAAGTMLATIVLQTWRQSHQNALLTLNALCAADILDRATAVATAFRQLMATYPTPDDLTYSDLSNLRFPFEATRFFQNQFVSRLRWTQRDVQALLLAVSRATERDVEHYQSQLAQAQQMLQMYRQGLKRLLVVVLDCLAQMLNRYRSETRVAGSEGDTTEASALQQWLAQRAQDLIQELLRIHLDQTPRLLGTLKALLVNVTSPALDQMLEDLNQLASWSLAAF